MPRTLILLYIIAISFYSCKQNTENKGNGVLSHEDIVSLEQSSTYSLELIEYEGRFEGIYFEEPIVLNLKKSGKYSIDYKGKTIEGNWFKKDDGSMMEVDSKKKLPFQFLLWSDNETIMILNSDGTADDNGGNYFVRIK